MLNKEDTVREDLINQAFTIYSVYKTAVKLFLLQTTSKCRANVSQENQLTWCTTVYTNIIPICVSN